MYLLFLSLLWMNVVAFHLETRHVADTPRQAEIPVRKATQARCPKGWVEGSSYCYILVYENVRWSAAKASCKELGGNLVSPKTETEWKEFGKGMFIFYGSKIWTAGVYNFQNDKFYWANDNRSEEIQETNWDTQEPSFIYSQWVKQNGGFCIAAVYPTYKWRLLQCERSENGYMCQKDKVSDVVTTSPEPPVTTISESNCPNGWMEGTSYCYLLIKGPAKWKDARTDCQKSYAGILASPNTAAENADVTRLAKNSGKSIWKWLGGKYVHETKKFYWSAGDKPEEIKFSNWETEPPEDGLGRWSRLCITMENDKYKWIYVGCNSRSDYICQIDKGAELPSFTSSTQQPPSSTPTGLTCPEEDWVEGKLYCYTYVGYEVSWEEARVDCQTTYGGMLASPKTATENEDIAKLMKVIDKSVWFGGSYNFKHQQFYWSAGDYPEAIQFQYWKGNVDPNNPKSFIKDDSHCIAGMPDKYQWGYFSCHHESFGYVCQREKGTSLQPTLPPLKCPPGWIAKFGWCYYFSDYEMNWHDAQTECESLGGYLAEPAFNYSMQSLTKKTKSRKQSFWIGGTDEGNEGHWVWSSRSKPISIFTNWGQNQPNNAWWNEHCLKISKESDYKWEDDNCFHELRFICQSKKIPLEVTSTIEPFNVTNVPAANCRTEPGYVGTENKCYFFSNTSLDWGQAEKSCNAKGGKLVEPKTQEEIKFVRKEARYRIDSFWIGGFKQNSWIWASNTDKMNDFDWSVGEPNSKQGNENCIRVLQWLEYHWSDQDCRTKSRFICQL